MNTEVEKQMENLKKLQAERDDLMNQLERSLNLQKQFPHAFDHGNCSHTFTGNASTPKETKFVLKLGNGKEVIYELTDVDSAIWWDEIKKTLNSHQLQFGGPWHNFMKKHNPNPPEEPEIVRRTSMGVTSFFKADENGTLKPYGV